MQRPLLYKALIVGALILLIGLPLLLVHSTISERMSYHAEAVRSIAADSVREQSIVGPLLVIPYTDEYEEEQVVEAEPAKTRLVKRSVSRHKLVFPNDLQVKGSVDTDQRYRGIHKVLVYSSQHAFAGDFILPTQDSLERSKPDSRLTVGQAYVALAIEDVRGIRNIPKLAWNGAQIEFEQGTGLIALKNGLRAPVDAGDLRQAATVRFAFDLGLDGIERLHFVPLAKNNEIALQSKWPHPQFGGRFLPAAKTRKVDANGFSATWNISALASNAQQQLIQLENSGYRTDNAPSGNAALENIDYFSVGFIEPVDIYSQAERAVKYGLLFVALTFAAFFLFELLKQLPIHPVQYLLVGLALVLFFLLLVSLSEHIRFVHAYLIASSACILLIGFYLSYALRDWRRGMGFGAALTVLYGVLFGLLQSENNALVMGSILLFGVLTAIMIATRKVDWYQVGRPAAFEG